MSISQLSLLESATITPSGGTALPFGSTAPANGTVKAFSTIDTDLRSRRTIDFSVKEPKILATAPAGYTQARANCYLRVPFTLDNGNTTTNTLKIEVAYDAEATQAEVLELRKLGAQILVDSDLDEFFEQLSIA